MPDRTDREVVEVDVCATWVVKLICECPGCGEHVDLIDDPEFWLDHDIDFTEHDTDRTRAMRVACPECRNEFEVCCAY